MFRSRSRRRAPILVLGLSVVALVALPGCYESHSHHNHHEIPHPTAFASETEFTWTGDLVGYGAKDEYLWFTVWDEVFVEFHGIDYFGEIRVQIWDDFFDLVFDQTFFGTGEEIVVNTMSELGFAGEWTVRITSFDVFGSVTLRLD